MRMLVIIGALAALLFLGAFLSFAFMDVDVPQKDTVVELPVPQAPPVAGQPQSPALTLDQTPAATPSALSAAQPADTAQPTTPPAAAPSAAPTE